MMVLVVGGSGSGKSSYAEKTALALSKRADDCEEGHPEEEMKKYYLATMRVFDAEGERKIQRHRRLRSGKGFLTIEQPSEILKALEKMEPGGRVALLECISNLTANEMFSGGKPKPEGQTAECIISGMERLREEVTHLVVVSNNVFEDGVVYEESTMEYIRAMGRINRRLAAMADRVVEVAAGIPVIIKQ